MLTSMTPSKPTLSAENDALFCSLNIDGLKGRVGMDCGSGFDKLGIDPFDELPPLFVWVDGNNPVVRNTVFPEEVHETDDSAL